MIRRLTARAAMSVAAVMMLALGGCHSSRQGVGTEMAPGVAAWHDVKVPVSVRLTQPSTMRLNGTLTMVNGKSIAVSLRMLGFEVAGMYATEDSIFAYARLQKVYVAENLGKALGMAGATLGDLQALLTGAPVKLPRPGGGVTVTGRTDATTGQLLEVTVAEPGGRSVELNYKPQPGLPRAATADITARSGGRETGVEIEYDWHRAEADKGSEPKKFMIPTGYRRIDAARLLKSLGRE
ncbi:MAG: DUF4292 domain-containing protein [Duncaniella sp.]|nr:DUF4292 domain-containing protein [Duncaniella sp.]